MSGRSSHRYGVSVLIPVYNEEKILAALLDRVLAVHLPAGMDLQIIAVDDGSSDASPDILTAYAERHPGVLEVLRHGRNQGKGAAVSTAVMQAKCAFSIIQHVGLEYDPSELPKLLEPLIQSRADAVYGSRFAGRAERTVLTRACNLVTGLNLTDVETGYKVFRSSLLQSIPIRSDRFGLEPELTIKLTQRQAIIHEVPVSYDGRVRALGGWKDAVEALFVILKYTLRHDIYKDPGQEILHAFSYAPNFNRWMADTIRPYVGTRVLEIGAGMGNLTRELLSDSMEYIATDIDEEHLERLKNRFPGLPNLETRICNVTNAADFNPLTDQVDTVICLNVIEHIADDVTALQNLYRVLERGGKGIILVPHSQEIYGSLDEALGHYRRYSQQQLREVMEAAGFTVEAVIEFNRISRPGWYISGKLLSNKRFSHLQLRLFDRFVWLWRSIDRCLPWLSTSIIAIAVKR